MDPSEPFLLNILKYKAQLSALVSILQKVSPGAVYAMSAANFSVTWTQAKKQRPALFERSEFALTPAARLRDT
jgi:hypothetical protein